MDKNSKLTKKYDRVMPRVYNRPGSSLKSSSLVMRHETVSSVRLGGKPSVSNSNVSASVYSELPMVLDDYKVGSSVEGPVKRTFVVKPRRTVKSLDPAVSPKPRRIVKSSDPAVSPPPRPRVSNKKASYIRAEASAPSVLTRDVDKWSDTHVKQCYSSRSHSKLKELKDEIKAYKDTDKLMKLRSRLYKRCGVVLDDIGRPAVDKAVQVEDHEKPKDEKDNTDRCRRWLEIIDREDLLKRERFICKSHNVCSLHFDESAFIIHKKLKSDALPTVPLGKVSKSTAKKFFHVSTQTTMFWETQQSGSSAEENASSVACTQTSAKPRLTIDPSQSPLRPTKEVQHDKTVEPKKESEASQDIKEPKKEVVYPDRSIIIINDDDDDL